MIGHWQYRAGLALVRILAMVLCSCSLIFAQGLGSVVGTITDPSGGLVAGASVKITAEGTSLSREATTSTQGLFVLPSLPPSTYTLSTTLTGFATFVRKGIILQADQTVTVNVTLTLQQSNQSVVVEGGAPQVDTSTSTLSAVVEQRRIIELPLNGRNAASLALITAGTVLAPATSDEGTTKTFPNTAVTISANGSRQNQASFRLDGASNNDIYTNVNQPFPFPDAVQEFSVQTSNYSARYGGNAGGVVNIVTKSGTNDPHGTLFEFNRNAVFNARSFFATTRDQLKRNQFGGTLGAPLRIPRVYNGTDKTFFFFGYQATRIRNTGLGQSTFVPTPDNLNGDFSALLSANDPRNPQGKSIIVTDPVGGNPFPNNVIPKSQLDRAALQLATHIPVVSGNGLYFYGIPLIQNYNEVTTRIDHSISDKDRISFRYFFDRFNGPGILDPKNLLTNVNYTTINSHNFMLNETHTISPTLLNDLRISYAREVSDRGPADGSISVADLGARIWQPSGAKSIQGISLGSGYFSVSQNNPAIFARNQYSINEALVMVKGGHSMIAGIDAIRGQVLLRNQFNQPGTFTFSNNYYGVGKGTADAMANLMMGQLTAFLQGNGEFKDNKVNTFGLFFQDDWHVNRRLTVNLGLRFDPFVPWEEQRGRFEIFYPDQYYKGVTSRQFVNAPPGLLFRGDTGVPENGLRANWKNFGPRVGFAFDLTGDGKTSLRAGAGLFYDALQNGIYNNRFVDLTPFSLQLNFACPGSCPPGTFADPYANYPGGNPYPAPTLPSRDFPFRTPYQVVTFDPGNNGQYQTPVSYNFNFMLERQLAADWMVRAGYVGSHASHLLETIELSPAVYGTKTNYFANFSSITQAAQDVNSNYNSLQVTVEKRFSRGFTFLANYTWSKSLDSLAYGESVTTVGTGVYSPIPWYMPGRHQFDYGPSEFDHQHRLVTSYVWQLPSIESGPKALRHISGGWQLSGLLSAQSGGPVTVRAGKDQSGTGLGSDRGQYVGGDVYGSGACGNTLRCVDYINPAAFALPAAGGYGNVGKGALRGPGNITLDAGLFKEMRLRGERLKLQFRAEFFNLFNHPNFFNPGQTQSQTTGNGLAAASPNVSGAQFGSIKAAYDPRIGQLALKFIF